MSAATADFPPSVIWRPTEQSAKREPAAPKPVQLQINTSGAWRNVVGFNAGDAEACGVIEYHAPALAVVGSGTLRIVIADGSQQVLRHWSLAEGWRDWKRS